MKTAFRYARTAARRFGLIPALACSIGLLGACDNLLEVELPGQMTEEAVLEPDLAPMLVNSAIAEFECGYSMMTVITASMEDTWWRGTGYWGGWAEYRNYRAPAGECATGDTSTGWYQSFQTSRFLAEQAYSHITDWTAEEVPDREQLLATAATYAGLAYQYFGETFCELAVDVGPIMTPDEVLAKSEEWFTTALEHIQKTGDYEIATTTSVKQLALLGRARVRLAQGNYAGAAEDAAQIQPGFVAWITRDASVRPRWNHIYRQLNVSLYSSIAGPVNHLGEVVPFTNYRYLTFDEQGRASIDGIPVAEPVPEQPVAEYVPANADSRVPVVFTGQFLQDGVTDNWQQRKYTSLSDPIPLARWAEAQLILAEVEARDGNGQAAIDHINALRDAKDLPRYEAEVGGWDVLRDDIIEERRREFFFEGRFLADKLRYDLWFPDGIGKNHKGYTYGTASCFLMPESEYNANPNLPDV